MKTKTTLHFFFLFILFVLVSFSDPYTIKRISDENFRYEFYVTDKNVTPKPNKVYYWFKGGAIHSAQSGFGGALLNDIFLKTYHNNQIAEKGTFKNGLKVGVWKTWHPNGVIESTQKWNKGLQTGIYFHYDINGIVDEKGDYKNGKKDGKWYDFVKKETTKYDNGIAAVEKQKLSKLDRLTLKLQELKDDASKTAEVNTEKDKITAAIKAKKDSIEARKIALVNEKADAKIRKKEAKEAEITTIKMAKAKKKATEKAEKETQKSNPSNTKKENLFNRLFSKKAS